MADTPRRQMLRRIGRLVRKEVSTILRDRRTVITLVLMPLLLYPLLSIGFVLLASGLGDDKTPSYILAVAPADERIVEYHLANGQMLLKSEPRPRDAPSPKTSLPQLKLSVVPDPQEEVRKGRSDLALLLRAPQGGERINRGKERALECEMYFLEGSASGREALDYVRLLFDAVHRTFLLERRKDWNGPALAPAVLLRPLAGALRDPEAKGGNDLKSLIPLVLILMTITGAVYPAIDLTAGERERGTLEILVAAPVPRLGLLFAKYVSVWMVAVLTAVINLGMMMATIQLSPLSKTLLQGQGFSLLAIVEVFLLLLLFAAFFSAILLAVTSFARSFKEAQAYLIPLMLVSLAPGLAGLLMPGQQLKGGMTIVPLLNIVLLSRDLLSGTASAGAAALVAASTLVYSAAAVALAARIFGAEAVLYSDQGGWSDLFRRPSLPQPSPTISAALLCLALLFPAMYVGVSLLSGLSADPAEMIVWGTLTNVLLFGGFPLLFAWMGRVSLRQGFRLERLGIAAWGAALLVGVGLVPCVEVLLRGLRYLGLSTLSELLSSGTGDSLTELSLGLVLLCFALIPPAVEELFFRGFLFGALLRSAGQRNAIIGSALFFGLFHLVDKGIPLVERGLSSAMLGLVLGWVCLRTGSVVPGIILHASFNASLLLLKYYQQPLIEAGWLEKDMTKLPDTWLALGALSVAVGLLWLRRMHKPDLPLAG